VLVADPVVQDGHELRPPHAELVVVERGPHRSWFVFWGWRWRRCRRAGTRARARREGRRKRREKGARRGRTSPGCALACSAARRLSGGEARLVCVRVRGRRRTMVMASSATCFFRPCFLRLGRSSGVGVAHLIRGRWRCGVCLSVTCGRERELEEEEREPPRSQGGASTETCSKRALFPPRPPSPQPPTSRDARTHTIIITTTTTTTTTATRTENNDRQMPARSKTPTPTPLLLRTTPAAAAPASPPFARRAGDGAGGAP
jgi:hypothetical protein